MSRNAKILLGIGGVALVLVVAVVSSVLTARWLLDRQAAMMAALPAPAGGPYAGMPMMNPQATPEEGRAPYPGMGPYGGMMGSGPWGDCGMMGPGMMGGGPWGYGGMMGPFGTNADVEPLSLDEAREILEQYLERIGDDNLAVREIMIFDNHAYAQIVEKDTGMGAWEVLIDPVTRTVTFEHGPTMMWNLKYSPMRGMMGPAFPDDLPEPQVSPEKAVELAQAYLDRVMPGATAEEPVAFYGYYTLHVLKDGQVVGMLSVNAYTGAVFPHVWHGRFIEMAETDLHTE